MLNRFYGLTRLHENYFFCYFPHHLLVLCKGERNSDPTTKLLPLQKWGIASLRPIYFIHLSLAYMQQLSFLYWSTFSSSIWIRKSKQNKNPRVNMEFWVKATWSFLCETQMKPRKAGWWCSNCKNSTEKTELPILTLLWNSCVVLQEHFTSLSLLIWKQDPIMPEHGY